MLLLKHMSMRPFSNQLISGANMSYSIDATDNSMKYESFYEGDTAQGPGTSSRKRRNSNQEPPEKRQRISDDDGRPLVTPEFAALVSQTAVSNGSNPTYFGGNGNTGPESTYLSQDIVTGCVAEYDPYLSMRILSLPILESLSVQILSTLTEGSYQVTVNGIADPTSDFYQAHATLVSLFDQTKKIYSTDATFLLAQQLNLTNPDHKNLIHMTNLATYVASVFGGSLGLGDLDENFLETFAPEGAPLESEPSKLLLNLKTQMYLSSVSQEEQEDTKEDLLERYFSATELRQNLENRHLHLPLTEAELRFLNDCRERAHYLMMSADNIETTQRLMAEFPWEGFLIQLREYIHKEPRTEPYIKRHSLPKPSTPSRSSDGYQLEQSRGDSVTDDFTAQISFAAQAALQRVGVNSQELLETHQTNQQNNEYPSQANNRASQPESTKALYDKARQAAAAKSNPGNARTRPGMPSQRRPWSTAEENALMAGLDQVKGPHWSQILGLYGPEGTINTVLKDRNQVQLKDKARNIKLFFLKSDFEVPSYLQQVTGELKTRAPTQAARREAEERARLASDDERARLDGIGILAGGMQSQDQDENPNSPQSHSMSPPEDGPEEFQVVEPENEQQLPMAPPQFEPDEQLRRALLGVTQTILAGSSS